MAPANRNRRQNMKNRHGAGHQHGPLVQFIVAVAMAVLVWAGRCRRSSSPTRTPGEFRPRSSPRPGCFSRADSPNSPRSNSVVQRGPGGGRGQRVSACWDEEPEIEHRQCHDRKGRGARIEFNDVSFSLRRQTSEGTEKTSSLVAEPGQTRPPLVGRSGSGKIEPGEADRAVSTPMDQRRHHPRRRSPCGTMNCTICAGQIFRGEPETSCCSNGTVAEKYRLRRGKVFDRETGGGGRAQTPHAMEFIAELEKRGSTRKSETTASPAIGWPAPSAIAIARGAAERTPPILILDEADFGSGFRIRNSTCRMPCNC